MFYVILHEYVGPNRNGFFRQTSMGGWEPRTQYVIQTKPGRTNMGRKEVVSGWLGTTNDGSQWAAGEFESVEDARKKIADDAVAIRKMDSDSKEYECLSDEDGFVEAWEEVPFEGFKEAWDPWDWFSDVDVAKEYAGMTPEEAHDAAYESAEAEGVFVVGLLEYLEERLAG